MITVHHLENSRSHRVLWLLEELGADYEVKHYQRDPETMLAPPALVDVHPLGKAPVITDGDVTVAESGAITEYLVEKFDDGTLKPDGAAGRSFTYWLHYAEGSFMPLMLLSIVLKRIEGPSVPFLVRPVAKGIAGRVREAFLDPNVKRHLDFLESSLDRSEWFCGDVFSAADIQMSYCIEAAAARAGLDSGYPRLSGFLRHIRARDAYQKALDVGGSSVLPSL